MRKMCECKKDFQELVFTILRFDEDLAREREYWIKKDLEGLKEEITEVKECTGKKYGETLEILDKIEKNIEKENWVGAAKELENLAVEVIEETCPS